MARTEPKAARCTPTCGSAGRGCIPGRRDISERPAIVDSKQRSGDWEADTILGKAHQGAAVTLVEPKSKYLLAQTVSRKTSALVGDAMQNLLRPFPALVLTVTCDNGKEFAGHRQTAEALDTDLFFARPYRSCERGLNEHTNGLLRQFVPKTENLCTLDPQRLQEAINRLNHRPREVLGYRTPYEVFRDDCLAAGINPPPAAPDPVLSDQGRNAAPPRRTFPLSSWRAQPASALVVRPPFRARSSCHPRVTATPGASP